MTGRLAGLLFLFAVIVLGLIYFAVSDRAPPTANLVLKTVAFSSLQGWEADDQAPALAAFVRGCAAILAMPGDREMGGGAGLAGDWRAACKAARAVPPGDTKAARQYFQAWFQPVAIVNARDDIGQFTGYYTPSLRGSRSASARYRVPLYALPNDYVRADLGRFDTGLAGRRIVGRVAGGRLVPAETRAEIDGGALDGRAQPILWLDNPIDAFFSRHPGLRRRPP
jgi:membrane-bound lytic murein transglycosylase A